ncbi:MAG: hypothetical protein R2766_02705 [Saprospiraceae bacterium]
MTDYAYRHVVQCIGQSSMDRRRRHSQVRPAVASLAKGAQMTLSIVLQVDPAYMGSLLTNNAEITSATNALGLPDEDSVIDGNCKCR